LLGLVGDLVAPSWPELARARLGPIALFSVAAGAIFAFAAGRWGIWPAVFAAGSWVFQPNLFGHGHYAAYDAVLTSLWVLAIIVFADAAIPSSATASPPLFRRFCSAMAFGVIAGCAAATKFTGWFLPLPFLIWTALYRSGPGFKTLLFGGVIATGVLLASIPPWWHDPVGGVVRFLESNLSRGKTIPIQVQFLGIVYNTPRESLPWYNTLVWTVLVTPAGFLILAVIGAWAAIKSWRAQPVGPLIVTHWAVLMLLRSLPHTPGHDGVRLFLPAFGALALLDGLGAQAALLRWGRWAKPVLVAGLLEGIASVAVMMPVPLSYFSPLVCGLPGARALGMEPTYYWDALGPEAREWLSARTGPGETIQFATFPTAWLYLRQSGALPQHLAPIDPGRPKWYVLQNRPGALSAVDRALVSDGAPAFVVTKLGVPLIWIFPSSEVARLSRRAHDQTRNNNPIGRGVYSPAARPGSSSARQALVRPAAAPRPLPSSAIMPVDWRVRSSSTLSRRERRRDGVTRRIARRSRRSVNDRTCASDGGHGPPVA
jgi:hypothetical protein